MKNKRLLRFAYLEAYEHNQDYWAKFEEISPYEAVNDIQNFVNYLYENKYYPSPKDAVASIIENYQVKLIPEESFKWLNISQERLCFFIWSALATSPLPLPINDINRDNPIKKHALENIYSFNIYKTKGFPSNPTTSSECIELITLYIDYWVAFPEQKKKFISDLRGKAARFTSLRHKLLNQLEKSNLDVQKWFWGYLTEKKNLRSYNLKPLSDNQFLDFSYIVLFLNFFDELKNSDNKEIEAIYSALQSKKYYQRKNINNNKSISLSEETFSKLALLAKKYKVSHKKLIEGLLDEKLESL